jgi:hypothetical protein
VAQVVQADGAPQAGVLERVLVQVARDVRARQLSPTRAAEHERARWAAQPRARTISVQAYPAGHPAASNATPPVKKAAGGPYRRRLGEGRDMAPTMDEFRPPAMGS